MKEILFDQKLADVTSDHILDDIKLVGDYVNDNHTAIENLRVLIYDGRSKTIYTIHLNDIIGYQPILFIGPFRNKQINDIFVSINSAGSGGFGYYNIFTFNGNDFINIFNPDYFNKLINYRVNFLNHYKIKIIDQKLNNSFIVDISTKDQDYLQQIYQNNGILKSPINGDVLGLNQLFPIDVNNDGIFELLAFNRIIGLYNADLIGYLQTILSWQNDSFNIFYNQQFVALLANNNNQKKHLFL